MEEELRRILTEMETCVKKSQHDPEAGHGQGDDLLRETIYVLSRADSIPENCRELAGRISAAFGDIEKYYS
jgi:hypothetical protein